MEKNGGDELKEMKKGLEEGAEMVEEERETASEPKNSKLLTEKTMRLMRAIAEHGCLTINEIGLIYRHQTHAYRVIKTLKDADWVGEFDTSLRPRTAYYLRPKGYRLLKDRGQLRLARRFNVPDFKAFIFPHRMTCAKVGLILEDHPLVRDFLPESLLWERRKDPNQKLCDGEFMFQAPSWERARRVGLEVELTLKNSDKLHESFEAFINRTDLDQVWWICGDASITKALAFWIGRIRRHTTQQHFLGMRDEVLKTPLNFTLHDRLGQVYNTAPGTATLPEVTEPVPPPPPKPEPDPVPVPVPTPPVYKPEVRPPSAAERSASPSPYSVQQASRWERFSWWLADSKESIATGVGLTIILAVFGFILRNELPVLSIPAAASTRSGWRTRRIINPPVIVGPWVIQSLTLRSNGDRYRLKLDFFNGSAELQTLRRVEIYDTSWVKLGVLKFNDSTILSQHGWNGELEFQGLPSMSRFDLVFNGDDFNKGSGAVFPIRFH